MTQKNDGGPAFPQHSVTLSPDGVTLHEVVKGGMSLRDYAAIHHQGFHEEVSADYAAAFNSDPWPKTGEGLAWAKWFAKAEWNFRYMQADAMIKARENNQ